ncbi:MAG: GDP-mannose 4,6-dehydratase, partial [Nanoarchaeota archaeon]|nr:GDP-mannose 4,6-dehydratase [Nanoarchaeota archaeon]
IYHLAAQSQVKISFEDEFGAFKTNSNSAHFLLSAIKELKPDCKFYFAGSSEMFGQAKTWPQDEETTFNPVSPYGISKTVGFYLTKMHIVADKRWFGRYYYLIFTKENNNFISWNKKSY